MHNNHKNEDKMVNSTQELFESVFKIILDEVADEDKIEGWREFYSFLSSGVETFLGHALSGKGDSGDTISLLMARVIVSSYIAAKQAQPEADFEIFRFMYMNSLERNFAKIKMAIGQYKRMSDAERDEFIEKYSNQEATG